MNNRRKLIVALGAGALVAPFASFAQQQDKVWRVGILGSRRRPVSSDPDFIGRLTQGMRDLGYVEGKNLTVELRFGDGKYERLLGLAAELVRLNVDAIVTQGTPATSAAQKATTTVPIVHGSISDPVGSGFARSLARPGGNITGLSNLAGDFGPKHFEMLRAMVPRLSRVAVLMNPANPGHAMILKTVQAAAQKSGIKIMPVRVRAAQDIENAFSTMARENVKAVIVARDAIVSQQLRQIAELSAKNHLASIGANREYPAAGGLMSYGANDLDQWRRAATYVDKIFKGAKPGDLPVEQPTIFELVINGKTAKALGLKIPQSLLISADKVIE